MQREYEALRGEMLAWQNRRFLILTASISFIVGALGLYGSVEARLGQHWMLVSSLLLFALGSAEILTWYAGQANAKMAAYIVVFHETKSVGWETRLRRLEGGGFGWLSLNRMVVLIYLSLGLLSVLVPMTVNDYAATGSSFLWYLGASSLWFVFGLYLLLRPVPREYYESLWRELESVSSDAQA